VRRRQFLGPDVGVTVLPDGVETGGRDSARHEDAGFVGHECVILLGRVGEDSAGVLAMVA
jgi:hypothetical protein